MHVRSAAAAPGNLEVIVVPGSGEAGRRRVEVIARRLRTGTVIPLGPAPGLLGLELLRIGHQGDEAEGGHSGQTR